MPTDVTSQDTVNIAIAVICILLGLSFGYKCLLAAFRGKISYWQGFLPITIVSPFFTHLPAGKRSMIKVAEKWWVHVIFGPIFFLLSLGFLAAGADRLGMPGSASINWIMTAGGNPRIPAAIRYNSKTGYTFPFVERLSKAVIRLLETKPFKDSIL